MATRGRLSKLTTLSLFFLSHFLFSFLIPSLSLTCISIILVPAILFALSLFFFCFLIFLKSLFFPFSILSQILITISLSLTLLADKELLRMRFIPRRRNKREEERERKCQSFSGKRERGSEKVPIFLITTAFSKILNTL